MCATDSSAKSPSAIAGASIAGLDGEPELLKGIALVAAWLVVFGLASGLRFVRTDVD